MCKAIILIIIVQLIFTFLFLFFFFVLQKSSWNQFACAALLECLHHEKLQALTPYLQLEQVSSWTLTFFLWQYSCFIFFFFFFMQTVRSICDNFEGEQVIQQLWQIKLAQEYVQSAPSNHAPLVSCGFTDTLYMRVRTLLEAAVKESPSLAKEGLNDLLKWYLTQRTETHDHQRWHLTKREVSLLLLTLILYDIPSPSTLNLTSSSKSLTSWYCVFYCLISLWQTN